MLSPDLDALGSAVDRPVPMKEFPSLPVFERNLGLIVENTRRDGVQLILATQPSLYRTDLTTEEESLITFNKRLCLRDHIYPDIASMRDGMDLFNRTTIRVAAKFGVPLLDLDAAVPRNEKFFVDDCHYTEAGNLRVARLVYRFLTHNELLARR